MTSPNRNANIVVIGGGPVGTAYALLAKMRDPALQIDVIEKHADYQRNQVLQLNSSAFKRWPNDPRISKLVKDLLQDKHIKTKDVEEKLAALAVEVGVRFRKQCEVRDPDELRRAYPNAKLFVGADGAHSFVRKKIFRDEMCVNDDLKFIVDLKYEVYGEGKKLNFFKQFYPALKAMNMLAAENIGAKRDNKTAMAVRMFINRRIYARMQDATFKRPYTFDDQKKMDEEFLKNIRIWLNLKAEHKEQRVPGSEKITVTRLGVYASKQSVKKQDGVEWALVGDAALGAPFFVGLKNGLRSAAVLAQTSAAAKPSYIDRIASLVTGIEGPLARYSLYMLQVRKREIVIARLKSAGLNALSLLIKINGLVPWQINYMPKALRKRLEAPIHSGIGSSL